MNKQLPEYVVVGIIERPCGVRGEVKVKPLTEKPERFKQVTELRVEEVSGRVRQLRLRGASVRSSSVYLHFELIDNRDTAKELAGAYLSVPYDEILATEGDAFYHFEVIGFEVRSTEGELLGTVQGVLELPANDALVVLRNGVEVLVPVTRNVIRKVERNKGQIVIELLDGLLH